MSSQMHIADEVTASLHDADVYTGWFLCGKRMTSSNKTRPNAPICPKCAKKAGWK